MAISKETEILAPLIAKFLENRKDERPECSGYISASQVGKCPRALAFILFGEKEVYSLDVKKIFDTGHAFHGKIEKYLNGLREMGDITIEAMEDRKYDEKLKITGKCDSVIKINATGERYLIELKSIKDAGYEWLKEPKPEHVGQAHVYMQMFDVRKALIVYENKDTQKMKEFLVNWDPKVLDEIRKKLKKVFKKVAQKKLPAKPYVETDWQCRYCSFKKYCWAKDVGEGAMSIFDTDDRKGDTLDVNDGR